MVCGGGVMYGVWYFVVVWVGVVCDLMCCGVWWWFDLRGVVVCSIISKCRV